MTGTPIAPLTGWGPQPPGDAMAETVSGAAAPQLRGTDNAPTEAALPTAADMAVPLLTGTDQPGGTAVPTAGPSPGTPAAVVAPETFTGLARLTPLSTEFTADEAVRACPLIESKASLDVDSDSDDGDASRRSALTIVDTGNV